MHFVRIGRSKRQIGATPSDGEAGLRWGRKSLSNLGARSVGPQYFYWIYSGGAPGGERRRDDTDSQNQSGHRYKRW